MSGYKLPLDKTENLLGALRPAVLVLNAVVPVAWEPVERMLVDLGYSVLRLEQHGADRLIQRRREDYLAVLASDPDLDHLRESLSSLGDERYSYIFVFPNNPRAYRASRAGVPSAEVRAELALNQRLWEEHCRALDGHCFTLLL
jgi:hypothetical protein